MTVTLVNLKSGKSIVIHNVGEFMNGSKWYWIESKDKDADNKELSKVACDYSVTGRYGKIATKDYQLLSIEA